MKKYLLYFLIAFGFMTAFSPAPDSPSTDTALFLPDDHDLPAPIVKDIDRLSAEQIDSVITVLTPLLTGKGEPDPLTATEIVKWLLRTLGSFLSTLILALLHKWFPNWFPSKRVRNYVSRKRDNTS